MTIEITTTFVPLDALTRYEAYADIARLAKGLEVNPEIRVGPIVDTWSIPDNERPRTTSKWCAVVRQARLV